MIYENRLNAMKQTPYVFEKTASFVSYLLIINIFFFRGIWFSNSINMTQTIPILVLWQFVLVLFHSQNNIKSKIRVNITIVLFVLTTTTNIILSTMFYRRNIYFGVLMILEILLNILIVFNFSYLIKNGIVKMQGIYKVMIFASTLFSTNIAINSLRMDSIRRFTDLPVSVNFLAQGISISICLSFYYLKKKPNLFKLTVLLVNVIGLLFLGSRSSLLGLILVLLLHLFSNQHSKNTPKLLLKFFAVIFIVFTIVMALSQFVDISELLNRLTLTSMIESGRILVWNQSFQDIEFLSLVLGRPWMYEVYIGHVHPHNIFISILRYIGLIPLIIFTHVVISVLVKLRSSTSKDHRILIYMFIITLVYSSLSGNFTRILTISLILGCYYGVVQNETNLRHPSLHFSNNNCIDDKLKLRKNIF